MAGTGESEVTGWMAQYERRLAALTRLFLRMLLGASSALLAVGTLAATFYGTLDGEMAYSSLLTIPGQTLGEGSESATVLGIGFLGLLLCTIVAVLIILSQWRGGPSVRVRRAGQVVAVLMAVGGIVPVLFTLTALSESSAEDAGPAMLLYIPGVALFGYLMFSRTIDELREE